jgi:uncharacterized protein
MEKIVVASTNKSAGKTCIITGLIKASGKKCGYIKPFGDRLVYGGKKIWDLDAGFIAGTFDLSEKAEDMTIGFDHSKIKYSYDEKTVAKKLQDMCAKAGKGKNALIIEGGSEMWHGASVLLDAISVTKHVDGKLVLIIDGEDYDILDDIFFMKKYLDASKVKFAGVIINKVADVESFKKTYLADLKKEKVNVLGIVPLTKELSYYQAKHLLDHIIAKNLTGMAGLDKTIKSVFIGDMSENAALSNSAFKKEGKMVVTSGDRSDMILAAIETGSSCILLTNGHTPHANLITKAAHAEIPMFMVPMDTYRTVTHLEHLETLLTKDDAKKTALLGTLIKKNVKIKEIL